MASDTSHEGVAMGQEHDGELSPEIGARDVVALVKAAAAVVASLATVVAAVFAFGAWYGGNARVWGSIESQVGTINGKLDGIIAEQTKLAGSVREHEWRLGAIESAVRDVHGGGGLTGQPPRGTRPTLGGTP